MRDYQDDAADCVMDEWTRVIATLVVMATGSGKTILFAEIIRRMQPMRAMILAHRGELITQAHSKVSHVTGLLCGIEMAEVTLGHRYTEVDVVISTIQTQCSGRNGGRMMKFNPNDFGILIIDESHHAPADSFKRVINYYRQNPNLKILGVTATPDRADEVAMGNVFESVAFDYGILPCIEHGWLVPIEQQLIRVHGLDFSKVRTTAGDLNGADLAEVMETEANLHGIADPTIQIIGNRKTLVFAASVKQAERLCEIFNRHKPGCAEWVCGKTDKDVRKRILNNFASGSLQIVVNCAVLTEGFDAPQVEVICMGRKTKSRSLYSQMVGRATRPLPGVVDGHEKDTPEQRKASILASAKPSCLILDFCGNSGRHKLITTADILGGNFPEEAIERAEKEMEKSGKAANMLDAIAQAERDIIAEKKAAEEAAERKEAARRAAIKARATYTTQEVNPFDRYDISPTILAGNRTGEECTEAQCEFLRKRGFKEPEKITKRQAGAIIGKILEKNLATPKQVATLTRFGYADADKMTMDQASKCFDELKANNWRRPRMAA